MRAHSTLTSYSTQERSSLSRWIKASTKGAAQSWKIKSVARFSQTGHASSLSDKQTDWLFTLRVSTVTAEITAGGMLQLTVTFGTSADHAGHHAAARAQAGGLRLTCGARRIGLPLQATINQHDALGHGLFR